MGQICVDLPNTNNKWVRFGLANVDTFIIRVGFGLANVNTICALTQHEHDPSTQITTPNQQYFHISILFYFQVFDFKAFMLMQFHFQSDFTMKFTTFSTCSYHFSLNFQYIPISKHFPLRL